MRTPTSTPLQLVDSTSAIDPFQTSATDCRPDSLPIHEVLALFNQQAQRTKAIIEATYSVGQLLSYVNGIIDFGMLHDSIGYLRILAFDGYTKDGAFEQEAIALEYALDDVFKDAERMKGLIIDVRVNTGGADPLAWRSLPDWAARSTSPTRRTRETMSPDRCVSPRHSLLPSTCRLGPVPRRCRPADRARHDQRR